LVGGESNLMNRFDSGLEPGGWGVSDVRAAGWRPIEVEAGACVVDVESGRRALMRRLGAMLATVDADDLWPIVEAGLSGSAALLSADRVMLACRDGERTARVWVATRAGVSMTVRRAVVRGPVVDLALPSDGRGVTIRLGAGPSGRGYRGVIRAERWSSGGSMDEAFAEGLLATVGELLTALHVPAGESGASMTKSAG